jgi:dihydrofolate reductase
MPERATTHDPPIALIVAVAENGVIGRGEAIPWRLPDDQEFFKRMTTGHAMVMGRATWDTFPKALPRRTSVVLTRNEGFRAEGALVAHDFEAALALAAAHPPEDAAADGTVFVIGGAAIYAMALPRASVAYVTRVHCEVEGDVVFDAFCGAAPEDWVLEHAEPHEADARHATAFSIETWRRRRGSGRR